MDLSFLSKTAAAAILNFQKWQIATLGNDKNGHVNFVAKCRYDILTLFWRQPTAAQRRWAILTFFAPQGRHVTPMGVKYGMEALRLLRAKFHPIGAAITV